MFQQFPYTYTIAFFINYSCHYDSSYIATLGKP